MTIDPITGAPRKAGRPPLNREAPSIVEPASSSTPALSSGPDGTRPDGLQPKPRRKRKPFGNQQLKLERPTREGYTRRFFNDVPGRIARAQEAGWEIVTKATGEPDTEVVGVAETGGALV